MIYTRAAVAAAGGVVAFCSVNANAATTLYPSDFAPLALTSTSYAQNFDTLAATATAPNTLPAGWRVIENGTNGNGTYGVGTGSSNAGNVYSFGAAGSTDRALGSLTSGSLSPIYFGAFFTNGLGAAIDSLKIDYAGEQWRNGSAREILVFEYSLDATDLTNGTWLSFAALNFLSPSTSSVDAALDGNAAANRVLIGATIGELVIPESGRFAVRWRDVDASGTDDGLAIDDFRLTATTLSAAVPEPATWAMMITGFGLVGAMRRRRAGATARVAA